MERVSIYVDAANFNKRLLDVGFIPKKLDFTKFYPLLCGERICSSINYYISPFLPCPEDAARHRNYEIQQRTFEYWKKNIPNFYIH